MLNGSGVAHCSVSASTQRLCAIVFLHNRVLDFDMPDIVGPSQRTPSQTKAPNVHPHTPLATLDLCNTFIHRTKTLEITISHIDLSTLDVASHAPVQRPGERLSWNMSASSFVSSLRQTT
jgi:hypothetical protein